MKAKEAKMIINQMKDDEDLFALTENGTYELIIDLFTRNEIIINVATEQLRKQKTFQEILENQMRELRVTNPHASIIYETH